MKSINEKQARLYAQRFLFENQLNEKYRPDDGHYISYNKDTPGPQINGDNSYEPSYIEEEMPILPSDLMVDPSYKRVIHDVEQDTYCPANQTEFKTAVLSLIEKCDDFESQDKIKKAWVNFKNIIIKVCENE